MCVSVTNLHNDTFIDLYARAVKKNSENLFFGLVAVGKVG